MTPAKFPATIVTDQPPLLIVRATGEYVAQLVIPGGDREAYILAHKICARVLERNDGCEEFEGGEVAIGTGRKLGRRPACLVVEICESNDEAASMAAEALVNAATEVARDAAGFATHRIERK